MTPREAHALILAAVDEALTALTDAGTPVDEALFQTVQGRRRIIARHYPETGRPWRQLCAHCGGTAIADWPCPDFLDVTRGLRNLPPEVAAHLNPDPAEPE